MPRSEPPTAGELNRRITLQTPTDASDTAGQMIPAWADNSTVWGKYEQTGGSEVEVGGQVRSLISGTVTIRANPAFSTPKMRLKINGSGLVNLIVNIAAVHAPDAFGFQTLIVEQPAGGITQ